MTNNGKISLLQWTKLILNFAIVVLLFLILLLQLAKQSSRRDTNNCEKQEQTEHVVTIIQLPFCTIIFTLLTLTKLSRPSVCKKLDSVFALQHLHF